MKDNNNQQTAIVSPEKKGERGLIFRQVFPLIVIVVKQKSVCKKHLELLDRKEKLVKYLITNGIDAKEKTSGWTALHVVCRYYTHPNLIDIVRLLIENGVNVTAKLNDDWTTLHFVCFYYRHDNLIDIARILISHGADVTAKEL